MTACPEFTFEKENEGKKCNEKSRLLEDERISILFICYCNKYTYDIGAGKTGINNCGGTES